MRPPTYLMKAAAVLLLCLGGPRNASCEEVNYTHYLESSLGQLCKLAKAVVFGDLVGLATNQEGEIIVRMAGCSNFLGAPVSAESAFVVGKWVDVREIKLGQPALVFISTATFNPFNSDAFHFDYHAPQTDDVPTYVIGGDRGILQGDHASLASVSAASARYWSFLRSNQHDELAYAAFLSELTTSSVERIRADAQRDWRLLIRFADIPTMQRFAKALPEDTQLAAYFDKILRWKEEGMPVATRDRKPTEADWNFWMSALGSTAMVDRIHALAEMYRPERHDSVYGALARWHEKVLPLLEDSDEGVRLSAALLLSGASDKRAWPVLVDGLQSNESYRRQAAWNELLRASGGGCPSFDPDAPPSQREQSIARLKDWVKTQTD